MPATLRIYRGPASSDRVLLLDAHELGTLREEVTDFQIPVGWHVISLALGHFHSVATRVRFSEGDLVELTVEENEEAILPILQGGFLRFHKERRPSLNAHR